MKIILPNGEEPDDETHEQIRMYQDLKFVSFGSNGNGITSIFAHEHQHFGFIAKIRDQIEGLDFSGAGFVETKPVFYKEPPKVEWGSDTCQEGYGFYMPKDPEVKECIELSICEAIVHIMREMNERKELFIPLR